MRRIYKYPLRITSAQEIEMPAAAVLLDVQVQHGAPVLWADVDPDAPLERRRLYVFGTGHEMVDAPRRHLATFQMQGGDLVLHVYDGGRA